MEDIHEIPKAQTDLISKKQEVSINVQGWRMQMRAVLGLAIINGNYKNQSLELNINVIHGRYTQFSS